MAGPIWRGFQQWVSNAVSTWPERQSKRSETPLSTAQSEDGVGHSEPWSSRFARLPRCRGGRRRSCRAVPAAGTRVGMYRVIRPNPFLYPRHAHNALVLWVYAGVIGQVAREMPMGRRFLTPGRGKGRCRKAWRKGPPSGSCPYSCCEVHLRCTDASAVGRGSTVSGTIFQALSRSANRSNLCTAPVPAMAVPCRRAHHIARVKFRSLASSIAGAHGFECVVEPTLGIEHPSGRDPRKQN
jgi:hypothetical protein